MANIHISHIGEFRYIEESVDATQIGIIHPIGLNIVDLDPLAEACSKNALIKFISITIIYSFLAFYTKDTMS